MYSMHGLPHSDTIGLGWLLVSGRRRVPSPPAMTTARTRLTSAFARDPCAAAYQMRAAMRYQTRRLRGDEAAAGGSGGVPPPPLRAFRTQTMAR